MLIVHILCSTLITLGITGTASADDGYRLWLKYDRLDDMHMVEMYRQTVSGIMVTASPAATGSPSTCLKSRKSSCERLRLLANLLYWCYLMEERSQ